MSITEEKYRVKSMNKYKYLIVRTILDDLEIRSTDLDHLEDLLKELLTTFPACEIRPPSDLFQQTFRYEINIRQKGKNKVLIEEVLWWVFNKLCNMGYRPLGEGRFVFEE